MNMVRKENCWEFKGCGRQLEGHATAELGVCPASTETRLDGLNDGVNAGRACWVVAGTFCGGKVQGSYAKKQMNCLSCDFYQKVSEQEGSRMISSFELLTKLSS